MPKSQPNPDEGKVYDPVTHQWMPATADTQQDDPVTPDVDSTEE